MYAIRSYYDPGASPKEIESRVMQPLEKVVANIPGVEYVYSTSMPGQAMLIVQFYVGEDVERRITSYNVCYTKLLRLASRMNIVREIGQYKKENNVTALQISRWTELMNKRVATGEKLSLDPVFVKILFQLIHEDSVRMQTEIMDAE